MKRNAVLYSVCVWLVLAVAGSAALARYAYIPSPGGDPATVWPLGTSLPTIPGAFTLVMLAHPHCPCTRSSLEELSRLMTRLHERLLVHVIFLRPAGFPVGWENSDLWRFAAAIPGVRVWSDADGQEVERFHGWTSGQVLLYDPSGQLRFSGGITGGRGHAGDNPGLDAVRQVLRSGSQGFTKAPAFGCSLRTPRESR